MAIHDLARSETETETVLLTIFFTFHFWLFTQIKSLQVSLLNLTEPNGFEKGTKRALYLLFLVACLQPMVMWWLTRHLAMSTPYSFGEVLAFKPGSPGRISPGVVPGAEGLRPH